MLGALSVLVLICGLGLCFLPAMPASPAASPSDPGANMRRCGAVFVCGILLNYGLVLVCGRLPEAFRLGALLSSVGYGLAIIRYRAELKRLVCWGGWRWVGFFALAVSSAALIVGTPLRAWDARSIWFFHAKLIFYNGGLDGGIEWANPAYAFSHLDYPKLTAGLAAEIAYAAGFWNEYLPKFSLLILFLAGAMILFSHARGALQAVFMVTVFLAAMHPSLSVGYMDGYVALFTAGALLSFCEWLCRRDAGALVAGLCALGLAANLKNEGLVAGALAGMGIVVTTALVRGRIDWRSCLPRRRWLSVRCLLPCVVVAPYILWRFHCYRWGLQNDMQLNSDFLRRIVERAADPQALQLLRRYMMREAMAPEGLFLFGLAAAACWPLFRSQWRIVLLPLFVAAAYYIFCLIVFLGTFHDLHWHLYTTYHRLELTVMAALMVALFEVVSRPDVDGNRPV